MKDFENIKLEATNSSIREKEAKLKLEAAETHSRKVIDVSKLSFIFL